MMDFESSTGEKKCEDARNVVSLKQHDPSKGFMVCGKVQLYTCVCRVGMSV